MSLSPTFWLTIISSFKLWMILARKGRVMIPQPVFEEKEVKLEEIQGFFYITGDVTIEIAESLDPDSDKEAAFIKAFKKTVDNVLFLPNVLLTAAFEVSALVTAGLFWEDIVRKFQ